LGYVQSNVTAQIQALEHELGVRLFDRLGKRVALTEAGERLLPYADGIFTLVTEAQTALTPTGDPKGNVRISAPESICSYRLAPLLQALRTQHPLVHPVFVPGPVGELVARVRAGEIDLAFALDRPIAVSDIETLPLSEEPIIVACSPNFPLASLPSVAASDLAGLPMLATEQGCAYRARFERVLAEDVVDVSDTFEFGSVEAIKQCAIAGMGFTVLPHMALVRELANGSLIALPWAGPQQLLHLQLLWHHKRWLSPALRAVIAMSQSLSWA
jgi:DNA-binding transcriptional LysR family regulator